MTDILSATHDGVVRAAEMLRDGKLLSFGTETVYGLGADATNANAVAGIFAAKGRPTFNPLICHYHSATAALRHVVADDRARDLAHRLWPGPLTLVLLRSANCPVARLVSAGLDTLAVRVPSHPVALSLLRRVGRPVAAPSANRSGRVSPTTAEHVMQELGGVIHAVLDAGPCTVGVESTVLDLTGPHPVLLRPGGIALEELERRLGCAVHGPIAGGDVSLRSPGMMASHYAPDLPVRLNVQAATGQELLLAFGHASDRPSSGAPLAKFQLSETRNPVEAAARLFEGLRWLDAAGAALKARGIAVMPIPEVGIGLAINDRLRRAAAPRGQVAIAED